jgi:quercetin dioxygenase-like cupin family protein
MRCKQYAAIMPAVAVLVLTCGPSRAGELDPAVLSYKLPDQIEWKKPFGVSAGIETAVVAGDPSKPGFYAVMVKWAPGNHFSRPHFHPHDRFITVLKGTWWVGTGTKFDPEGTVAMPAGSFVVHYGRQVHFDGAKDEETVLLIVGDGPETPTPAEAK